MHKHIRLSLLYLILTLLIISCRVVPLDPTEEPSIEVIDLQIIPALTHWLPDVALCANEIPDFGINTQIVPQSELDLEEADLILRLGERESEEHVAVMGIEEIIILVGPNVPLTSLSANSLQAIFSGTITNWNQVPEIIENDIEINQTIKTFSYPDGHTLRMLFSQSYLDGQSIGGDPILFSTPEYGLTLIEESPYGIVYILKSQVAKESQVSQDIQVLTISDIDPLLPQQYVLAITPQEPQGSLRQLLLCLQNSR